jgi:hypothetical protein
MSITDLNEYRRARDAGTMPLATVLTDVDPDNPDTAWHLVVHETRDAVQSQIDGLIASVQSFGNGGYGSADGPHRRDGKYFAIVKTVRFPDV